VERLAEALLKLIKDENLRREMGARGQPRAVEFDWSLLAKKLTELYTETLNRVNRQPAEVPSPSSDTALGQY
jgi:glycosyltransferase involved in cell wall biosynthesis